MKGAEWYLVKKHGQIEQQELETTNIEKDPSPEEFERLQYNQGRISIYY